MKIYGKYWFKSIPFYLRKVMMFLVFICAINVIAQKRTLKTEADGYQWYATSSTERYFQEGAEDLSGRTIIPHIYHSVDYDVNAKAFRISTKEGYGYINKDGEILVPAKYKVAFYKNGRFYVELANGSIEKLEDARNGNAVNPSRSVKNDPKIEVRTIKCKMCSGNGKCYRCKGDGNIMGAYSYINHAPTVVRCHICSGLKKCTLCKGSGAIETFFCDGVEKSLDEINMIIGYKSTVNTGISSSDYSIGDNGGNSNYGNNDKIVCPDCKGSGKHTFCKGRGVYKNSYDFNWYDCDMCNKTGTCPTCHGKTYIWAY